MVPVVWTRPLIAPDNPPPLTRAELGLPEDRFLFYFSFELMSVMERKNPLALGELAALDIRRDYSAEVVGHAMLKRMRLAVYQQGMRG